MVKKSTLPTEKVTSICKQLYSIIIENPETQEILDKEMLREKLSANCNLFVKF